MDDIADDPDYVVLNGVHKSFLRKYGAPTIRAHVHGKQRGKVDQALSDVTLNVSSGEAVAVLGRRRSGKSTLISVVNGLYRPDQGSVAVRGRVGGPVALGVGFAPSLSARDNITLNAQVLGMTPAEVTQRWDAIVAFSGIKSAELAYPMRELDGKSKQRLAYSVMLHARPDILLADGRVVVGDSEFREASLTRLEQMRDEGHAMLLATNTKPVVRRLCTRAIVLDGGTLVFDGEVREARRVLRRLRRD